MREERRRSKPARSGLFYASASGRARGREAGFRPNVDRWVSGIFPSAMTNSCERSGRLEAGLKGCEAPFVMLASGDGGRAGCPASTRQSDQPFRTAPAGRETGYDDPLPYAAQESRRLRWNGQAGDRRLEARGRARVVLAGRIAAGFGRSTRASREAPF